MHSDYCVQYLEIEPPELFNYYQGAIRRVGRTHTAQKIIYL